MIAHISTGRDVALACLFIFGGALVVLGALRCGERAHEIQEIEISAEPPSPAALPTGLPSPVRP